MKLKLLTNLSVSDFPPPDGEGPYLEGQSRSFKESIARTILARGWAVAQPSPPEATAEPLRDVIGATEVIEAPPRPRRGR